MHQNIKYVQCVCEYQVLFLYMVCIKDPGLKFAYNRDAQQKMSKTKLKEATSKTNIDNMAR